MEHLNFIGVRSNQSANRKGGTLENAEDAVSKTDDTIFSSLIYMTQNNLSPWFFRVSFNNYIDLFRKKKREKEFIFRYVDSQSNGTNL